MFREKEICNAIRTAYLYLFPDKLWRSLSAIVGKVSLLTRPRETMSVP